MMTFLWFLRPFRHNVALLGGLAFLYLFLLWLPWFVSPRVFTSPDETINNFFIERVAKNKPLAYPSPATRCAYQQIAPRSTVIQNGLIVPTTFLGMIVYIGWIARIAGIWIVPFITPLLATIALLCLFHLFRLLFSKTISVFSVVLIALHPAWWLYASRPLYHTMFFMSTAILGIWFLVFGLLRKKVLFSSIGGIWLGIALGARTSEALWLVPAAVVLLVLLRSQAAWKHWVATAFGMVLSFLPVANVSLKIFGQPLASGYTENLVSTVQASDIGRGSRLVKYLLPFGFHPIRALDNVFRYGVGQFPWYTVLFFLGTTILIIAVWKRKLSRAQCWYFGVSYSIVAWLVVLYGSWQLNEYSNLEQAALASSFLRYWLPIVVLLIPFAATGILTVMDFLPTRGSTRLTGIFTVIFMLFLSSGTVWLDPLHGLWNVQQQMQINADIQNMVVKETQNNAIIISGYADKVVFPKRNVIVQVSTNRKELRIGMQKLLDTCPLYAVVAEGDAVAAANIASLRDADFHIKTIKTDHKTTLFSILP